MEPIHQENRNGVIHIPDSARETKPSEAIVVALGHKWPEHLPLKVGDRVLTKRFEGVDVKSGGRAYRMLAPDDVLAIVGGDYGN